MADLEFTGDYYQCQHCWHVWDYMDTCCPECGSNDVEDINSKQVRQIASNWEYQSQKLIEMVERHGD